MDAGLLALSTWPKYPDVKQPLVLVTGAHRQWGLARPEETERRDRWGVQAPLTEPDTECSRPGQPRGQISVVCTYLPVLSFWGLHLEACGILVSPTRDQTLTP